MVKLISKNVAGSTVAIFSSENCGGSSKLFAPTAAILNLNRVALFTVNCVTGQDRIGLEFGLKFGFSLESEFGLRL